MSHDLGIDEAEQPEPGEGADAGRAGRPVPGKKMAPPSPDQTSASAYGGPGWTPRKTTLAQELGTRWAACGLDTEWRPLKQVLLHRPGREMEAAARNPAAALMLEAPDPGQIQLQHDALAQAYREAGVAVHFVDPPRTPTPNQMFCADLLAMTLQGAILARPASETRAGEERWVARTLGILGVPILRSVGGSGCFEGADLMWMDPGRVLLAEGLRTNAEGASQVAATLREQGVEVHRTTLPEGTMHLMGTLRIMDRRLAAAWPGRLPEDAVTLLRESGFSVHFIPDLEEAGKGFALNVVTLGPRKILMPAGNSFTEAFYRSLGVEVIPVPTDELGKAAGSIGCLTGILERERA